MRSSGILMPIFSLASEGGIGTFGKEAYRFVDFLKSAKQSYWQILPLTPTGHGDSPYSSFSAFAGNPYFIDIEILIEEKLLKEKEFKSFDFGNNPHKVALQMIAMGWANIGAAVAPDAALASVASAIILVVGGQGDAGVGTAIAVAIPLAVAGFSINYGFFKYCNKVCYKLCISWN